MKKHCFMIIACLLLFDNCKKQSCITAYDAVTSKIEVTEKDTIHTFLFLNNKSEFISESIELSGYTSDKELVDKVAKCVAKRQPFKVCLVWGRIEGVY